MGKQKKSAGPAIAIRGSGEVLGLTFRGVGAGLFAYAATVPIPGKLLLDWVGLQARQYCSTTDLYRLYLSLGNVASPSMPDLHAGEKVFPHLATEPGFEWVVCFGIPSGVPGFDVGKVIAMNGRRFMAAFYNTSAGAGMFHVLLGVHRVVGGEARSGGRFMGGEHFEWR